MNRTGGKAGERHVAVQEIAMTPSAQVFNCSSFLCHDIPQFLY